MAQTSLPPGFRFHPTDVELVSYYLKRKIMGKKLLVEAISEVELYKFAPWDLPDKSCLRSKDLEWFFFCPRDKKYPNGSRTNRATPNGYWKTSGKDRTIMLNSRNVGNKKTLIFHEGKAPKGDRTDWVMYEYKMEDEDLVSAGFSKDAYVLCKIFKKSGLGPRIGEQYGAPFNEDEWDISDTQTSIFPLMPSSEVVNPMEDLHVQHAVPAGVVGEPHLQHSSAACAGDDSSFYLVTSTCVEDFTFGSATVGSAIQDLPAQHAVKSSGGGVVSGNNISNEVNDMYNTCDVDGFLLEELSRFLNDSPLHDSPVGENSVLPPMSEVEARAFEVNTYDLYNELSGLAGLGDVSNNFASNVGTTECTILPADRELSTDDYIELNDLLAPDASFPSEFPAQNNQFLQYPLAQFTYNGRHDDVAALSAAFEPTSSLPTMPGIYDVFPPANNVSFATDQATNFLDPPMQYPLS
ncbi:NAC domain-containing protein 82-like [Phragmites australis]|uniref:NAC domain-containing protein 82-like n=1 Tax=Phragmites australis TaxID=29695 RepID=UPI002D77E631|nr:NAC domain-containing protein 82-like [Phragmites australis]XP_062231427.1 NAC domain-containing protein 82-like [Phragmites australis]